VIKLPCSCCVHAVIYVHNFFSMKYVFYIVGNFITIFCSAVILVIDTLIKCM
jgi:hypothetical protein